MPTRRSLFVAAAQATLIGLASRAAAQPAYPARPIEVIIPFQPGDTDNMLRPFTEKMNEFLGQPLILNYRPGAGGGVGAKSVASSKPDGYTLLGTSQGSLVVVPLANKDIKYTSDAFAPIASMAEGGLLLVVASSSPWKTLNDLVEYSKASPGKINYSSSGLMGITHLLGEIFAKEAGISWTHIAMQGSGPAIVAVLGGHVELASTAIAPALAHIRAGTLRPLAAIGEQRLKALPDVPTLKELGYKTASPVLYGISAPRDTPREIVDRLFAAARQAVDKYGEQIAANLAVAGAEIRLLGPDQYAAYLKQQHALFAAGIASVK